MKPFDAALKKMRAICLALPETKETPTWGQPHFRVGEKIFSGLGEEKGVLTVGAQARDGPRRRDGAARRASPARPTSATRAGCRSTSAG